RGLRLVLPAALLPRFDLAATARGLARGPPLPGHVVPVQAVEPPLAPVDPAPAHCARLATRGGGDPTPPPAIPTPPGGAGRPGRDLAGRRGGLGRRLSGRTPSRRPTSRDPRPRDGTARS